MLEPKMSRSLNTTEEVTVATAANMSPIHPGEILLEEYLEPLGVTQHRLAIAIGVPPRRINEDGGSALTQRCAWRVTSARPSGSG
jgi:addiction module HigA family antidote